MKQHPTKTKRLIHILSSPKFFWSLVVFLVLQALWIALTGKYPMAFDENFHLGIIRLYASHISPFWSGQPANGNAYGAVARDPSYLFQYLMSFPYRFICIFTNDQTIQVIFLRLIDIAFFASGLPLYRKLFQKLGVSDALTNVCFAVFILLPIVPLLAAQINYDNLLIPLVALNMLITLRITAKLRARHTLDVTSFMQLLICCFLTCLVKYTFLPIFVAIVVFMALELYWHLARSHKLGSGFAHGLRVIARRTRIILILLLLLSAALFGERYGINVVRYHTPIPSCGQVLTVNQCSAYSPWERDYVYKQDKVASDSRSPVLFTKDWFYGMWLRMFFAVGPAPIFQTRGPLFIPAIGAVVFASVGGLLMIVYAPRLLRRYDRNTILLFAAVVVFYVGALWLDDFRSFLQTGVPVAINGRYLLPILPLFMALMALSYRELLVKHARLKLCIASFVILCLIWGGGTLTYILRSNDEWYWSNSLTHSMNRIVRRGIGPIVPSDDRPTAFLQS